mmetsp:Transcript_49984/g.119303  ORF Transcript_49984/g.119303 Transcript_49984/m.119303 type:complete len:204 (+) Transcript_49984:4636-5247(+)
MLQQLCESRQRRLHLLVEHIRRWHSTQHCSSSIRRLPLHGDLEEVQKGEDGLKAAGFQHLQRLILRDELNDGNSELRDVYVLNIQQICTEHRETPMANNDPCCWRQNVDHVEEAAAGQQHHLCRCLIAIARVSKQIDQQGNEGLHRKGDQGLLGTEAQLLRQLGEGQELLLPVLTLQIPQQGRELRGRGGTDTKGGMKAFRCF